MGFFSKTLERFSPTPETAGAQGFGAPLHIAFEYRELPGSGARQYAYETMAIPMTTAIGWGVQNQASFNPTGSPIVAWDQTLGIESLFWNGDPSGQMVGQPLVNVDSSQPADGLQVAAFSGARSNELPM